MKGVGLWYDRPSTKLTMKTSDFDYSLPTELIAQVPLEPRDRSRLMVINRNSGSIEHRIFSELTDYLEAGDVLVFNDSQVIPARFYGRKTGSGGRIEILLLRRLCNGQWEALLRPGKRTRVGTSIEITKGPNITCRNRKTILATVVETRQNGIRIITFSDETLLPELGNIPLPPYIHTPIDCVERYQTVYASKAGSVAAPTAGLHMSLELMNAIRQKGVDCLFTTLHIGLDTFRPVSEEDPLRHAIHQEYGIIERKNATRLNQAKLEGRRVICVGTTSVRLVEQITRDSQPYVEPFTGWVDLFILPGYHFRMTDAMITNFHLPRSTLLMMVSAFAGSELIKRAYNEAISRRYRFYSFGDAMLIL